MPRRAPPRGFDAPFVLYRSTVSHRWYFAYGSNMQTATLRDRRGVDFRRAVAARVPGWRLVLDKPPLFSIGHAFANIVPDPGAEVLGVLYELTAADLDHVELTEGVRIGNYAAVDVEAWPLQDAAPLTARSLSSSRREPALRPSTRYMALLIEGALEHGLPAAYVETLRAIPADAEGASARAARTMLDTALRLARPRP